MDFRRERPNPEGEALLTALLRELDKAAVECRTPAAVRRVADARAAIIEARRDEGRAAA